MSYHGGDSPKTIEFRVNDGVGGPQAVSATVSSLAGAWHHVAVTVDRDGYIKLYLDGEEQEGSTTAFTQTQASGDDIIGTTAFVGGAHVGGTWSWDGLLDEMRVWHEVLSDTDVAAIYASAESLFTTSKKVEYTYDALDRRIRKEIDANGNGVLTDSGDEVWQMVYDGEDVILTTDASGSLKNRYLHGPAVDQILADEDVSITAGAADRVRWTLTDNIGSVRLLADNASTTTVDNRINYDPYGNVTYELASSVIHIYGWTGRERDYESHLQNNRARYYDAALGSWISADPIGFAAGDENLYRYVGNSPTNFTDPRGTEISGPGYHPFGPPSDSLKDGPLRNPPPSGPPEARPPIPPGKSTLGDWLREGFDLRSLWYELNGYHKVPSGGGKWYWVKGGYCPIEEWKKDADRIPLSPIPTDELTDVVKGDLFAAALGAAKNYAVGKIFKFGDKYFQKVANGEVRAVSKAAGEAAEAARTGDKLADGARAGGKAAEAAGTGRKGGTILDNAEQGRKFEDQVVKGLSETQDDVARQLTVRTKDGTRTRLDAIGTDKATGESVVTEVKSSATAPLTRNQSQAFPQIESEGAKVVGKGRPGYPGGTQIPPSRVQIVRPSG